MQDLKVIENELVTVYETSTGEKVVYGTELHAVLEVKSNYREWVNRRFLDIDALAYEDYEAVGISTASGQSKKEHIIKLDAAKEMAMLERDEKGKQVRRYFIELEKKYKSQNIPIEKLSLHLQVLANMELKLKEHDERFAMLETRTEKQAENIRMVKNTMIAEGKETGFNEWVIGEIEKIASSQYYEGDSHRYQTIWRESYKRLTDKAGCNLNLLLRNARKRAENNGATKAQVNNISKLTVISNNKRLRGLYISVIKEMTVAYFLDVS